MDEHNSGDAGAEQQERVIAAVLQRISAAPARVLPDVALTHDPAAETLTRSRAIIDIESWRVPALAAAAVVMIASGAIILSTPEAAPGERSNEVANALPAPVAAYLETGTIAPIEWLNTFGGRQ